MEEVKEGFICPICLSDLSRPDFLQAHFEKEHSDLESAPTHGLKSLLHKAKNKILGTSFFDDSVDVVEENEKPADTVSRDCAEVVTRSRTAFFRSVRQGRVEFRSLHTKQLFTRLEKLFSIQEEARRRRILEKHVTPWADDRDIKRCPDCCRSFRLTCRKHHCRLCGYIICNSCSLFLSSTTARQMIEQNSVTVNSVELSSAMSFRLRSADSLTSINSSPSVDGERHIRICSDCRNVLQSRCDSLRSKMAEPVVLTLYKQVSSVISNFKTVLPKLSSAIQAVIKSDSDSLTDVNKLYQEAQVQIDSLHKAIGQVDNYISDCASTLSPKELTVVRNLRVYIINFLQNSASKIPTVPDETELRRIRYERRQQECERKVDPVFRSQISEASSPKHRDTQRSITDNDPLYQQIEAVKKYIRDARKACRYDEVMILEANLRELQLQTADPKPLASTSLVT